MNNEKEQLNEGLQVIKEEVRSASELIRSLPNAIELNEQSVISANDAAKALIEKIQREGMNEETDSEANRLIAKADATLDKMMSRRKPATELFDRVRKAFTSLESSVDKKKPGTLFNVIQEYRNLYAADVARKNREREEELQRKQRRDAELISFREKVSVELNSWFINSLSKLEFGFRERINSMTLESSEEVRAFFEAFPLVMPEGKFKEWTFTANTLFLNQEDRENTIAEVKFDSIEAFRKAFSEKVSKLRSDCLDLIPGKVRELEEQKKAIEEGDRKKQEEILLRQKQREEEERLRIEEAKAKAKAESELKAKLEAEAATAEKTFENEIAAPAIIEGPKAKEDVEIHLTSSQGIVFIFQKWFELEGKNWPVDKLEKKLSFMFTACEKETKKTGETIDSKLLKYQTKTIARTEK